VEAELLSNVPLRDIKWKSSVSSSPVSISQLPLRFLPATASLFKDTDHPFRWFLAPYVNMYLISGVESLEAYRAIKPKLKSWVDSFNGVRRESWVLVYIPRGNPTITYDYYQKVYARLCADFYAERPGDRCVFVVHKQFECGKGTASSSGGLMASLYNTGGSISGQSAQANHALQAAQSNQARVCISELMAKLRDGVIASFEYRCILYDTEIRKLDTYRGTNQLDFKQLFLVKESLSLMYQMLSLYNEALVQLRELEVLLTYIPIVPTGNANNQPLVESPYPILNTALSQQQASDTASVASGSTSMVRSSSQTVPPIGIPATPAPSAGNFSKWRESWTDASKYGEEVLLYSINSVRMRVLKNKIGLLELYRYLFARIAYFLTLIGKPGLVVEKSLVFITFMRNALDKKFRAEGAGGALPPTPSVGSPAPGGSPAPPLPVATSPPPEGQTLSAELLGRINGGAVDAGAGGAGASDSYPSRHAGAGGAGASDSYPSRQALADVWVVTAAVRVTQYTLANFAEETQRVLKMHENHAVAVEDRPPFPSQVETSKQIVSLLHFALNRLLNILIPHTAAAAVRSGDGDASLGGAATGITDKAPMAESLLVAIWQRAMEMTAGYAGWDSLGAVSARYPFAFPAQKLDRERKCSRFISASASAATVVEGLEESVSAYPQKLRHMLRATLYALSGSSSSRRSGFSLIDCAAEPGAGSGALTSSVGSSRGVITAQQCQFDALLLLISYIAIHSLLAERPRFAVMSLAKCIDIQLILGNFSYAKDMLVKLLFSDDAYGTNSGGDDGGGAGGNGPGGGKGGNTSTEYYSQKLSQTTRAVNFILQYTSSVSLVYQPPTADGEGRSSDADQEESPDFSLLHSVLLTWPKLRYWMLRKLLLVCRILATENVPSYPANVNVDPSTDGSSATDATARSSATAENSVLYMKTCLQLLQLGLEGDDLGESPAPAPEPDDECKLPPLPTSARGDTSFQHSIFADLISLSNSVDDAEDEGSGISRACSSPRTVSSISSASACGLPALDTHTITSPFLPYFKMSIPMSQWRTAKTAGVEEGACGPRLTQDRRLLLDEKYSVSLVNYSIAGDGGGGTFDLHLECFFPAEVVVEECYIRFQHFSIPSHSSHYHMDEVDLLGEKDRSLDDEDFGAEASALKDSAAALASGGAFRATSGGDSSSKFGVSRNASRSNRDLAIYVDAEAADDSGRIPSPPMSVNSPNLRLKSFYELLPPYTPQDPTKVQVQAMSPGAAERQVSFSPPEDAGGVAPISRMPSDGSRDESWAGGVDNCTIPPFFDCHPVCMLGEEDGTGRESTRRPLVIKPGKQVIPFRFQANTVGEFIPCEINLRVGSRLNFHQPLEANHNQLGSYFRENTVFSVQSPTDVVRVALETPNFTPVSQRDEAVFHLMTRSDERINELHVYAYCEEGTESVDPAQDFGAEDSPTRQPATPLGLEEMIARSNIEMQEAAAAATSPRHRVDVAPSGEWQVFLSKLRTSAPAPAPDSASDPELTPGRAPEPAVPQFNTTIHDLVTDSDALLQGNPDHRVHYDYCDDGNGFSLTHLGDSRQLSLSVPFTTIDSSIVSRSGNGSGVALNAGLGGCKIHFTVTGTMIRENVASSGRCVIPFSVTRIGAVNTGVCLSFSDLSAPPQQAGITTPTTSPESAGPGSSGYVQHDYHRQEYTLSMHGLASLELLEQKVVEKIRDEKFWEANKLPVGSAPTATPAVVLLRVKETRLVQCMLRNTSPIDLCVFGHRMHLHPGVASSTVSRSFRPSKTEVTVQHDIAGYTSTYASAQECGPNPTPGIPASSPILACVSSYCIVDAPDELLGAGHCPTLVVTPGEEYAAVFSITRTTVVAGVSMTQVATTKNPLDEPGTMVPAVGVGPTNRRSGVRLSNRDADFTTTATPVLAYARLLLPFPPVLRTADGYTVKDCLGITFEYRRHPPTATSNCSFVTAVAVPLALTAYNFSPPPPPSPAAPKPNPWLVINFSLPDLFRGLSHCLLGSLSVTTVLCDATTKVPTFHAGDIVRVRYTLSASSSAADAARVLLNAFDRTADYVLADTEASVEGQTDYLKLLLTPLATLQLSTVGKVAHACSLPRATAATETETESGPAQTTIAEITVQLLCNCSGCCPLPPLQVVVFPTFSEGNLREQGLTRGQSLAQAQAMQPLRTIKGTSVLVYPSDGNDGGSSVVCVSPHSVVYSSTMRQPELF